MKIKKIIKTLDTKRVVKNNSQFAIRNSQFAIRNSQFAIIITILLTFGCKLVITPVLGLPPKGLDIEKIIIDEQDKKISFTWENPYDSEDDLAGVIIQYDIKEIVVNIPTTSITFENLINNKEYIFKFTPFDKLGNYGECVSLKATPLDRIPPSKLNDTTVIVQQGENDGEIIATWELLDEDDFAKIKIILNDDFENPIFVETPLTTYIFTELNNLKKYNLKFYAVDTSNNVSLEYSERVCKPRDLTPPRLNEVTVLTQQGSKDGEIIANWTIPSDEDFSKVKIVVDDNFNNPIFVETPTNTYTFTALNNLKNYNLKFYAVDTSNNISVEYVERTCKPRDLTPPGILTNINVYPGTQVSLGTEIGVTWKDPYDSDFKEVVFEYTFNGTNYQRVIQKGVQKLTFGTLVSSTLNVSVSYYCVDYTGNKTVQKSFKVKNT